MNLICPECGGVMWLEWDKGHDDVTAILMRYATHHVDECLTCSGIYEKWEKDGVFDV